MFIYKSLHVKDLYDVLVESIKTFAPILFILASAVAFSRIITLLQIPDTAANFILNTIHGKVAVLIVINILLLIVGMVMDTSPAILILTPILLPIAQSVGVDAVHFGIIMVVNIAKKALPLIGFFFIALLLITFIPQISLAFVA